MLHVYGSVVYQTLMTDSGAICFRSAIVSEPQIWNDWKRLDKCDGGNADTASEIRYIGAEDVDLNELRPSDGTLGVWKIDESIYSITNGIDGVVMRGLLFTFTYGHSIWGKQIFTPWNSCETYMRTYGYDSNNDKVHFNPWKKIVGADSFTDFIQSNPNLVDNPDFRVNQRGQAEYTSDKLTYSVDRCMLHNGMLNVSTNGIKFVSNHTTNYKRFLSKTEYPLAVSEKVTISMMAKINQISGNVRFRIFDGSDYGGQPGMPLRSSTPNYEYFSETIVANKNYINVGIEILVGNADRDHVDIDIKHWKLEFGSIATPFIPPNPATELMKCQRYFYKKRSSVSFKMADYAANNQNGKYIILPEAFPVEMRTTPTVTLLPIAENATNGQLSIWSNAATIVGSVVHANAVTVGGFSSIRIENQGTAKDGDFCTFRYTASADL